MTRKPLAHVTASGDCASVNTWTPSSGNDLAHIVGPWEGLTKSSSSAPSKMKTPMLVGKKGLPPGLLLLLGLALLLDRLALLLLLALLGLASAFHGASR